MKQVLEAIELERQRQKALLYQGKIKGTAAEIYLLDTDRYLMLARQTGKLAHAISMEADLALIRSELVQTAAICVAWCEALDRESQLTTAQKDSLDRTIRPKKLRKVVEFREGNA